MNWRKLFATKQKPPLERAKNDIYYFAFNLFWITAIFVMAAYVSTSKELQEALGLDFLSVACVMLAAFLFLHYLGFVLNAIDKYLKIKKGGLVP